jgi:hypothetical protein
MQRRNFKEIFVFHEKESKSKKAWTSTKILVRAGESAYCSKKGFCCWWFRTCHGERHEDGEREMAGDSVAARMLLLASLDIKPTYKAEVTEEITSTC